MDNKEYIGLDVGMARTGFARGSSIAKIAQPLFTVPTDSVVDKLKELIKTSHPVGLVIGLPRNLNGDDTNQTTWVREWVDNLKKHIDIPIYAQDEALTSKLAEAKRMDGLSEQSTDALAASIILQDFLESSDIERKNW